MPMQSLAALMKTCGDRLPRVQEALRMAGIELPEEWEPPCEDSAVNVTSTRDVPGEERRREEGRLTRRPRRTTRPAVERGDPGAMARFRVVRHLGTAPAGSAPPPRRRQQLDPLRGHLLDGPAGRSHEARQQERLPELPGLEVDTDAEEGAGAKVTARLLKAVRIASTRDDSPVGCGASRAWARTSPGSGRNHRLASARSREFGAPRVLVGDSRSGLGDARIGFFHSNSGSWWTLLRVGRCGTSAIGIRSRRAR
jgi:hypothetical protein